MDHLQKFISQVRAHLLVVVLLNNALIIGGWWISTHVLHLAPTMVLATLIGLGIAGTLVVASLSTSYLSQPVQFIWQAILHIAPNTANSAAPDLRHAHLGKELVTTLIAQVYEIAHVSETIQETAENQSHDLRAEFVANNLPLPIAILDADMNIVFANNALCAFTKRTIPNTIGQNVYSVLDMSFTNDHTFDRWLDHAKAKKITATRTWERVRLNAASQEDRRLFDMVAYYNKQNPQGFEIMLAIFDRTRQYSQDEQAMSFVALAVHELRTPLTLLRGYIDVFEEEFEGKLDDELTGFMYKMKAAAQQLAAFTSNVLNVSRFENDQLVLQLQEEQWGPLLTAAVQDMSLRAKVRGVGLDLKIEDNLPTVGVDSVSIYEVVSNLIDNAIKYSGDSKEITIHSYLTKDNMVETVVQDNGTGIPESAIPNLFDKFYRDHHNRSQVGGTGMGLYLSKAIITAHGGNIWVQSKEGKGSTFGFTLAPYSSLADAQKKGDNAGIVRTAHGWIKNHSMYRR